jgi:hypothetical protein
MNADSADATGAIDDSDALAKLGALNGGLLPSWTGTNHCQIVMSIHRPDLFLF